MAERGPNQSQRWYCEKCERKTIHILESGRTSPMDLIDIEHIMRKHKCECGHARNTIEIPFEIFKEMQFFLYGDNNKFPGGNSKARQALDQVLESFETLKGLRDHLRKLNEVADQSFK